MSFFKPPRVLPQLRYIREKTRVRPETSANTIKILSWNVAGLRGLLKKQKNDTTGEKEFAKILSEVNPDILLLQETKLQTIHEEEITKKLSGLLENHWKFHDVIWSSSILRKGYSGTATFWKNSISVQGKSTTLNTEFAKEGRIVTIELPFCFIVNVYVPNSGQELARLETRTNEWDTVLSEFIQELQKTKPVVLGGDLNVAHQKIDFFDEESNVKKQAGLTPAERKSFFEKFIVKSKMVDTFRYFNPTTKGVYSFWDARHKGRERNAGLRIDYFLVSESLCPQTDNQTSPISSQSINKITNIPQLFHAEVLDHIGEGLSDHCPVLAEILI